MEDIFSKTEQRVLKTLGKSKLTISEIVYRIYGHPESGITNRNNTVAQAVRNINTKCEYHKMPWFLNGVGTGRAGKLVWKDKR